MKILVLNCGSSSIKYQLLDMGEEAFLLAKGLVERIGINDGEISHKNHDGSIYKIIEDIPNHTIGINLVLEILVDSEHGVLNDVNEIKAVGHRVVHGGEKFTKSILINDEVMLQIKECSELAPLHNPANIKGIEAMEAIIPNVPQVAVFDTSFHTTMPNYAYLYGVPYQYYNKYKVRRYGFHGTSHKYVAHEASKFINRDINDLKIVTCHLGNGASITAVKNGKSIDTSMGMTPVEGLLMGTRCGDIGLGAVLYIMEKDGLSYKESNNMVNKKCGLLGVSGISPDMRDLQNAAAEGHERAKIAIDMFAYRIEKYIGAYTFALGGLDMIVFTGGIGENATIVRQKICEHMSFIGLDFDKEKNSRIQGEVAEINKPSSRVKCVVMPTNEELVIATDTKEIVK